MLLIHQTCYKCWDWFLTLQKHFHLFISFKGLWKLQSSFCGQIYICMYLIFLFVCGNTLSFIVKYGLWMKYAPSFEYSDVQLSLNVAQIKSSVLQYSIKFTLKSKHLYWIVCCDGFQTSFKFLQAYFQGAVKWTETSGSGEDRKSI